MRTPLKRWYEAVRAFADEYPEYAREMRYIILEALATGAMIGMILTVVTLRLTGRLY